jgi:hypothetical protein
MYSNNRLEFTKPELDDVVERILVEEQKTDSEDFFSK